MDRIISFIVDHRTTTRILAVTIPFIFVWALTTAALMWTPGLLETAQKILTSNPAVFWGVFVAPGAVMFLYATLAGARYLWLTSEIIYQRPDE